MSITPRGMSIQEAYRNYRDGQLIVNRRYQRKLVWTTNEKAMLIDSVLKGYPIPLILLAKHGGTQASETYEIIDGMQRFNAIFAFIENEFPFEDKYFDVKELPRARQAAEMGAFNIADPEKPRLSQKQCADFLDYQLAVTMYPTTGEDETTRVFGRINSSGRFLSPQERRQAGVVTPFAELIRQLAAELRGDASKEVLLLTEMPEISIDSKRSSQNYGIKAEDTLWVKQGVLAVSQLRNSEDEEMIADIAASILLEAPIAKSRELLDELYNPETDAATNLNRILTRYSAQRLAHEIKATFSVIQEIIEDYDDKQSALRRVVYPGGSNPIKTSFYAIFMAFFDLIVRKQRTPDNPKGIMGALKGQGKSVTGSAHYATKEERERNINITKGLIERFFVEKEPPVLFHGPALAQDFENSLRRSRMETNRYEFKQGLLKLSSERELDNNHMTNIVITLCGMANLGPDSTGYLHIGVADRKEHAQKIEQLDGITFLEVAGHFIVGVGREARVLGITLDAYEKILLNHIRSSALSEPLKTDILKNIDFISYRGLDIVRITIPAQKDVSFFGDIAYIREGSSTIEIKGPRLAAIFKSFQ